VVPQTTGKFLISVWGLVDNTDTAGAHDYEFNVNDGTNILYSSGLITIPIANGSPPTGVIGSTFSATFWSDNPTNSGTPETYAVGVGVTFNLNMDDPNGTGKLLIPRACAGICVTEILA
jgi:hypothetical protein